MKILKCFIIIIILSVNVYSFEQIAHWPGGPCQCVAVNENYAFMASGGFLGVVDLQSLVMISNTQIADQIVSMVANGNHLYIATVSTGVVIYDVTDGAAPQQETIIPVYAMDCSIYEDRLYIASSTYGLSIYDIADPADPLLVGSGDAWGYTRGVAIKGDYAYIPQSSMGLKAVDISDPSDISQFSEVPLTNRTATIVKVYGDYLYVGSWGEDGFEIFDVSDPGNPVSVKYVDVSSSYKFAFLDNYLFLAAVGDHLKIYNITNPPELIEVTEFEEASPYDVAVTNGYVCMADQEDGMYVFPLTDEKLPQKIKSFDLDFSAMSMFSNGPYLYFPIHNQGLRILDVSDPLNVVDQELLDIKTDYVRFYNDLMFISYLDDIHVVDNSNPANPREISEIELPDRDIGVLINYPYLYAYCADVVVDNYKLVTVNISDPANPVAVDTLSGASTYYLAEYYNHYLFLCDRNKQLHCVDASDPENMEFVSKAFFPDSVAGFWIKEHYAYVTDTDGMMNIYDMSEPLSPVLKNTLNISTIIAKPLFYGELGYAPGFMGTDIYDFSNPALPVLKGFVSHGGYIGSKAIVNGRLFVQKVIMEDKLQIFDLSQPLNPGELGLFPAFDGTEAVLVKDGIVYTAANRGGLRIFDFSQSDDPLIAQIDFSGKVVDLAMQNDYLFLAESEYGMRVVNVTDPAHPFVAGEFHPNTNSAVGDIIIDGQYAYLIGGPYNDVIDISDPENPEYIADIPSAGINAQGQVLNSYLYLADQYNGLKIMDVSDPQNVTLLKTVETDGYFMDVCIHNNYAYIADINNHLMRIFDLTDPINPTQVSFLEFPYAPVSDICIYDHYALVACDYSGIYIVDIEDPLNPINVGRFYIYNAEFTDVTVENGYIYATDTVTGVYKLGDELITAIEEASALPQTFRLFDNYPNPFNPVTTITYTLPEPVSVKIDIFNINGQHICTLVDMKQGPGVQITQWDGKTAMGISVSSGLYFYRIQAGANTETKKMMLLR